MDADNFFFCLTSTSTCQILNQEPGFSFRTGKIGIFCLGILQLTYCFHPRAGAGCSCPLFPALLSLYPGNFVQSSLPMSFSWEWEDNPVDTICKIVSLQGLVVSIDSLPRPGSYHLPLTSPNSAGWGLDLGNVWGIFQILPGLVHFLQAAARARI